MIHEVINIKKEKSTLEDTQKAKGFAVLFAAISEETAIDKRCEWEEYVRHTNTTVYPGQKETQLEGLQTRSCLLL